MLGEDASEGRQGSQKQKKEPGQTEHNGRENESNGWFHGGASLARRLVGPKDIFTGRVFPEPQAGHQSSQLD